MRDFSFKWPQLSTMAVIKYPQICETVLDTGLPALVEIYGILFKLQRPPKYNCSCSLEIYCSGCMNLLRTPPKPEEVEVYGPAHIPAKIAITNRIYVTPPGDF